MTDHEAVVVRWGTDQGPRETRGVYGVPVDLVQALRDQQAEAEQAGLIVVALLRVYTQPVPVIAGEPVWTLAGALQRVPVAMFHVEPCGQEVGT
jgi:hypothetical protein